MKNEHLKRAVDYLNALQYPEGYWNAQLETNCCMEAQWLMACKFCDIDFEGNPEIIRYILNSQREDGSWDVYYNAEKGDVNTTLECYFALRLFGKSPDEEYMKKARAWLVENNWNKHIRVFTKYWLALFGEWKWKYTPALPPEIIYFPKIFPLNIYKFAAWARATIMPLCVVTSQAPVMELPEELRMRELIPADADETFFNPNTDKPPLASFERFFKFSDRILHFWNEKLRNSSFRKRSIKKCMQWILEHQDDDGFWGGIQPPWIYAIIAMKLEGFDLKQQNMASAIQALNLHWTEKTEKGLRIKASESPVWDTMLAANALLEAGESPDAPELSNAIEYLLQKENRHFGDWSELMGRKVEPSGWAFQRENKFYPDIDDTAVAICVLKKYQNLLASDDPRRAKISLACTRAEKWILAMQSKNGGWAAFDKDNTTQLVTKIPFCDFGEVLDPPSVDVTAHVLEALVRCGLPTDNEALKRGLDFIFAEQEDDGSWFGRWGINYIYGTWCVLTALSVCGFKSSDPRIAKALSWLISKQNEDGGWGENAGTYMQPHAKGNSTASQTAWAIIALSAFETEYTKEIERGIKYLKDTQNAEGSWDEYEYTGTGFPGYGLGAKVDLREGAPLPQGKELSRGFMLRYGYYCHYFPIVALSTQK